jgi:hypothetical protein
MTIEDPRAALEALEVRLNTILPEEYQGAYEDVQPTPMGSAGLQFDADGRVAWNEIWDSFCDLAMAGGPPHKGKLLEPGTSSDIDAAPYRQAAVVQEICRGVRMVTGLETETSPVPGWIRVRTLGTGMAGWLLRAIVMENVAVRAEGVALDLPAAPAFRLEKEIKNVVTVIAKTCHYWMGHIPRVQQRAIARLFATLAEESPLVVPATAGDARAADAEGTVRAAMADAIRRETVLQPSERRYTGWLGVETPSVRAAVWMMRAMVVSNVLARREETALFVPVHPVQDPGGSRVVRTLATVHSLAAAKGML